MSHRNQELSQSPALDPYRWHVWVFNIVLLLTLPLLMLVILKAESKANQPVTVNASFVDQNGALEAAKQRLAGQEVFTRTCAACHGPDGQGVPFIGKPLRNSAFVQATDDAAIFELIANGRAVDDPLNTTGALMPPRGAVALGDQEITDVIAHLRKMQDPSAPMVSVEAWDLLGSEGGGQVALTLENHDGFDLYIASCAACHGEGAEGMEGLGLPLTTSGFVRGESDEALVRFIKSGRPMWDANNTTGIDMPPKGGNPAITDEQILQIIQYMRALQEQALASN